MSASIEEYLEALYTLTQNGKTASTTEISQRLSIAPASVTEMLKKLAARDFIKYSPYQGTTLTDKGLEIARKMTRKHRLLERFLYDTLKIGKDSVHPQACEMEHALSDDAERALCQFLKHPARCPDDGKIIPPCDLRFSSCEECLKMREKSMEEVGKRSANLTSIADLKEHESGRIGFIRGDHKVLQRLLDMGLTPGTRISVLRVAPLKGPVEVAVRSSKLALGQDIASNVFIDASKDKREAQ